MLSLLIPLYNEEDNVALLYQEIRKSVDHIGIPYEVIFIDDGSSDRTFDRLRAIKKKEAKVEGILVHTRIFRFSRNFGQTAAMQAGTDYARGDVIIIMDGDLQNDPKDIPLLLNKIDDGYDVVCGWRRDRQDKFLTRIVPSVVANWLIRKVTGVPIHDNGCSLKAFRREVIKTLRLYSNMHRFIPAMTSISGARITEIVVNHRPRRYGKTKYGLSRIWQVLADIITIKMLIHFHHRPMLWFGIFSLIFLFAAFGFGIASVLQLFREEQSIVFATACFLFFFLAGNLISWGILAEFLVKAEKSYKNSLEVITDS